MGGLKSKNGFLYRNRFIAMAFLAPFVIMLMAFALAGVAPFGDRYAMVRDWRDQYYSFLLDFRRNIRSGEFPLWSWTGNVNYIAMCAYYLVSPSNLVACLLPEPWLGEYMTLSVCGRIAFAGMAMAIFLRGVYKHDGFRLVLAGCSFSFCAFFMGYYWNVIWLDAVAMTPLVVLGAVYLLRDGRFRLYVLSLAFSLAANFYIGYFTCIFVFFTFVGYHVLKWDGIRTFFRRLARMAAMSVIAICMAAVLLVPAYMALRNTSALTNGTPDLSGMNITGIPGPVGFLANMLFVMSNTLNFTEPAVFGNESLPNVSCGTVALVLYVFFLADKRIPRRERAFSLGLVLFMFASCVIAVLDYAWHGFHFTNMIPYRFTYLVSFVMVVCAFRECLLPVDGLKPRMRAVAAAICLLVLAGGLATWIRMAAFWLMAVAIASVAAVLCIFRVYAEGRMPDRVYAYMLAAAVLGQCCVSGACGVRLVMESGGSCFKGRYPAAGEAVSRVIDYAESLEAGSGPGWRMEVVRRRTANDNFLYGYECLGVFSSMANHAAADFFRGIGLHGNAAFNRYFCTIESSPFANVVMGVKYLVEGGWPHRNTYDLEEVHEDSGVLLLENRHYVPLGFMADAGLLDWDTGADQNRIDPFDGQAGFFRMATRVQEPLYHPLESAHFEVLPMGRREYVGWDYEVADGGLYCIYVAETADEVDRLSVQVNGTDIPYDTVCPGIQCIGELERGDRIVIVAELCEGTSHVPDGMDVYVERFDTDVFERGYERLSRDTMTVESRTGSGLSGTIDASEDGLLFLAIPYESGWTAEVDGAPAEIKLVGDCMMALALDAGHHEIRLSYMPSGLMAGASLSVMSVGIFALLCLSARRRRRDGAPRVDGNDG